MAPRQNSHSGVRFSRMLGRTLREAPANAANIPGYQFALRGALIRPFAAGSYSYLPLGWRVLKKIERIIREEMATIGCLEMRLPMLHPAEERRTTDRWVPKESQLVRFKNRMNREFVLADTHEEVLTSLVRREINSYRQLPLSVYQLQTKYRDEPHFRGDWTLAREIMTMDAYSLHATSESLDQFYRDMLDVYTSIFNRCKLTTIRVEAPPGIIDGAPSHEFVVEHPAGEDILIVCSECGSAANLDVAEFKRDIGDSEPEKEPHDVATPGCKTISELANFLDIPKSKTLKAVFYATKKGELIMAIIRGDLEINELKLGMNIKDKFRPASDEELIAAGIVPGYASPIGVKNLRVLADLSIQTKSNFVAGANKEGFHRLNVNYPRDFKVDELGDFALAKSGYECKHCGSVLKKRPCMKVAHLCKVGAYFGEMLGATFLDEKGQEKPLIMGTYGIDTSRLMATIIEAHHDQQGILWPASVAPFQIHLIALKLQDRELAETSEKLFNELQELGYEVLFDDRIETPGVKFNDADLIGIPIRLVISPRNLKQNGIELSLRHQPNERKIIQFDELYDEIKKIIVQES